MAARWVQQLPLSRGDKMLIGLLLLLSLASLYVVRLIIPQGAVAVVEVDGRSVCRLDLSVDTHRTIRLSLIHI